MPVDLYNRRRPFAISFWFCAVSFFLIFASSYLEKHLVPDIPTFLQVEMIKEPILVAIAGLILYLVVKQALIANVKESKLTNEVLRTTIKRLENEKAKTEAIIAAIGDGISIQDADFRIIYQNTIQKELMGDHVGEFCYKAYENQESVCEECPLQQSFADGRIHSAERSPVSARSASIEITSSPVYDSEGKIIAGIEVIRNITKRKETEEALRASEERFALFMQNLPGIACMRDREGRYVYVNEAWKKLRLTQESGEWAGRKVEELFHPESLQQLRESDAIVLETKVATTSMVRLLNSSSEAYLLHTKFPILDGNGDVALIAGIGIDITQQKNAEKALLDAQRQQKAILDSIPDMAWLKDREGRFIMVNEAFSRSCGVSKEAIVGLTDLDVWPKEIAIKYREVDQQVMESAEKIRNEELIFENNREPLWVETIKVPIFDDVGRVVGTSGIARDVTERKEMMEALRESSERFRLLFENTSVGIAFVDTGGNVIACNSALRNLLGYENDDLEDFHYSKVTHPDDVSKHETLLQEMLQRRNNLQLETRYIRKDGTVIWGRLNSSIVLGGNGDPAFLISMVEDITERKEAEAAVLAHQQMLSSLTAEISLAEERERQRIAAVLHDHIGQTLALARIRLISACQDGDGESIAEVRKLLDSSIKNIRSLTVELFPPVLHELGLAAALEWLGEKFAEEHQIKVSVTKDDKPKDIPEEIAVAIYQMVRELLINVVKHAKAKNVAISARRAGSVIEIIVNDDGVGIPTGQQSAKNSGFGLFSIRQRVDYFGGSFLMESERGKGTAVTLTVPITARTTEIERMSA